MAEFRSALVHHLTPGRHGAEAEGPPIVLSERPLASLFQIAGWPDDFEQSVAPVMETLGLSQLGPVGQADEAGGLTAFRTAPERLLIRTEDDSVFDQARDAVDESALCLLDLSHARTVIRLEGPEARNLLARLVSVDLRDDVMPVNGFALTGIHGVSVMLHRVTAAALPIYDLYIPYTWAASLWDLTCQAALPLGYEVATGARQGT